MNNTYLLAIDQGTSATKAVVFNTEGRIAAKGTEPLASYYPQPGFVEQEPLEIYQNVLAAKPLPGSVSGRSIIGCKPNSYLRNLQPARDILFMGCRGSASVPGPRLAVQAFGEYLQPSSGLIFGTGNNPSNRFDCGSLFFGDQTDLVV